MGVRTDGGGAGRVRCGNIVVAAGGEIAGEVESLTSQASRGRAGVDDGFRRSESSGTSALAPVETEPAAMAEDK